MSVNPSSEMTKEIETVKTMYADLNKGDLSFIPKIFDPNAERVEFEGTPNGGRFRGHNELISHFQQGRATWAEGSCTPERLLISTDKVVALVFVRVRLKNRMDWLEGHVGDVFTFQNGLITEFRSFLSHEEALQWAEIS